MRETTDSQRMWNQLHQIALLHTALRHAKDALGDSAPDDLKTEMQTALDASEGSAPDVVAKLLALND